MSIVLRAGLIIVSLLTLIFITRKVRKSQIRLEDSLFWVIVAIVLLVISIFPEIIFGLSRFAEVESPANLVFLCFIFILLILGFNLSVRTSQTDTKLKELTQQLAIEKFERYCDDREIAESEDTEQPL